MVILNLDFLSCSSCERWHKMHFQHAAFRIFVHIHMNTSVSLYAYLRFSINIGNVLSAENFHLLHAHKHTHTSCVVDRKRVSKRKARAHSRKHHFNSESERNSLFCDNEKYRKKCDDLVCSFISDLSSYNIQHSHIPHAYHSIKTVKEME